MLLKSLASSLFLLASLQYLPSVAGAPQPCDCQSGTSTGTGSSLSSVDASSGYKSASGSSPSHTIPALLPALVSGGPSAGASGAPSSQSGSSAAVPTAQGRGSDSGSEPSQTGPASSPSSSSAGDDSTPSGCSSSNTTSPDKLSSNTKSSGGASNGPKFVIYSDKWVTNALPDVSKLEGYNVFALSFLLSTGAADQAMAWQQLDDNTRKSLKSKYESAGIKVIVSAFGATETPTTAGADATKVANDMANWVKKYNVDGIDVDYEDLGAMNAGDGKAEEWLATFTKTLRGQLPQGKYIITHAPLPPWFNSESYKGGGYQKVNKEVGNMIDWYNVQFYNQNDYTDCDSLLTKSKTKTSLFEIAGTGVDKNKLLIGKPATAADASNGFMDTKTLAGCVKQAKDKGWNAGVMVWQYPNADSQWIKDVRGDAFPVGK